MSRKSEARKREARTPEQATLARVARFLQLAMEQADNLPAQPYGLELHERINGLRMIVSRELKPKNLLDAGDSEADNAA